MADRDQAVGIMADRDQAAGIMAVVPSTPAGGGNRSWCTRTVPVRLIANPALT